MDMYGCPEYTYLFQVTSISETEISILEKGHIPLFIPTTWQACYRGRQNFIPLSSLSSTFQYHEQLSAHSTGIKTSNYYSDILANFGTSAINGGI